MKTWVVTGPIGAGKSSVTKLLAERGAAVVDADWLGHEVLADPAMRKAIGRQFGQKYLDDEGVNRARLGSLVFNDPAALKKLNALTHPPLVALATSRLEELERSGKHNLAVLEAAVYFLWPPLDVVDLVISVVADPEIRLRRLMLNRGLHAEQVAARFASQSDLDALWRTADVILENNNHPDDLRAAVEDLLRENNL